MKYVLKHQDLQMFILKLKKLKVGEEVFVIMQGPDQII